jgi:hypothetical protein
LPAFYFGEKCGKVLGSDNTPLGVELLFFERLAPFYVWKIVWDPLSLEMMIAAALWTNCSSRRKPMSNIENEGQLSYGL